MIHIKIWYFEIKTKLLITTRSQYHVIINKGKTICRIIKFIVSAEHRVKNLRKIDKYLNLDWELRNLWNVMTVIPIVIGALEMALKDMERGLEELEIVG